MQSTFTTYTLKVTILTIVLSIVGMSVFTFVLKQSAFPAFYFIIVIFYSASLVAFYLLERLTKSNPKRFIQFYTLFSGMKLLFYSLSLVILLLVWRTDAIKIAFTFVSCYVCFTGMEIVSVLKSLR